MPAILFQRQPTAVNIARMVLPLSRHLRGRLNPTCLHFLSAQQRSNLRARRASESLLGPSLRRKHDSRIRSNAQQQPQAHSRPPNPMHEAEPLAASQLTGNRLPPGNTIPDLVSRKPAQVPPAVTARIETQQNMWEVGNRVTSRLPSPVHRTTCQPQPPTGQTQCFPRPRSGRGRSRCAAKPEPTPAPPSRRPQGPARPTRT